MQRFLSLLCFGFGCILIQSNFFLQQHFFPVKPDLTIPFVVYVSLSLELLPGTVLVAVIGYLLDVTSGGVLGLHLFLRITMFFLIHLLKNWLFFENKLALMTTVLTFFFLDSMLTASLFKLIGKSAVMVHNLFPTSLYQSLFTIALWIMLFPVLLYIQRTTEKSRGF